MSQENSRKLTPLQMEQFIIHLKSEIEKYKVKSDLYKKEAQKMNELELIEKNNQLSEEIRSLQDVVEEQENEQIKLKEKCVQYGEEILTNQEHITELKTTLEDELNSMKEMTVNFQKMVDKMENTHFHLLKEVSELKDELRVHKKKSDTLEESLSSLKDSLSKKLNEFEDQNKLLSKKANELKDQNTQTEEDAYEVLSPSALSGFKPVKKGSWTQFPTGIVSFKNQSAKGHKQGEISASGSIDRFLQINPLYNHSSSHGTVDPFKNLRS